MTMAVQEALAGTMIERLAVAGMVTFRLGVVMEGVLVGGGVAFVIRAVMVEPIVLFHAEQFSSSSASRQST